jgi:hypothetical protein
MPKVPKKTPQADPPAPEKRPRGRPRADGAGPVTRVNLTLDAAALAIAERVRAGNVSQAIREALRFWAEHHPPPGGKAAT